ALLALAAALRSRVLRLLLELAAALLLAGMALDAVLVRLFVQRFYVADLLRFAGELPHDWSVARDLFLSAQGAPYGVAAILVVVVLAGVFSAQRSREQAGLLAFGSAMT